MKKEKFLFCGLIVKDGDEIKYQAEKPNTDPYNPSGKAIITFDHKNFKCKKLIN